MRKQLLSFCVVAIMSLSLCAANASAELVITFSKAAGDTVNVSWSGSGTLSSNYGTAMNFNDFADTPFSAGATGPYAVNLQMTGGSGNVFDYTSLEFMNGGSSGAGDVQISPYGLAATTDWTASGSSFVAGLAYSDLTPGSYLSTSGDSSKFGGVRIVTRVPEPTSLLMFGVALVGFARRRR